MADRETDLMLRVKAGDRAAFAELFGLFEKPILNYLFRLGKNRPLAEDLLQEAFLRVWKAAPSWEPAAKVSTWIFKIAYNLYLNEAARRAPLGELVDIMDVGYTCAYLATPYARRLSGETLYVDGGVNIMG